MTAGYDETLAYLRTDYLTLDELAGQSGVDTDRIERLIETGCLPPHSHEATLDVTVATRILGSHQAETKRIRYYHPSLVAMTKDADREAAAKGIEAAAAERRNRFDSEIARTAGLEPGSPALAKLTAFAWEHWRAGTFGVCLKEIAPGNMVQKLSATEKMQALLDTAKSAPLGAGEIAELKEATQQYEEVAGPFGPHEVEDSTRVRVYGPAMRLLGERDEN